MSQRGWAAVQPQGREGGGRKGSGLAPDGLFRIAGEGKGRASAEGCFTTSCGCVCIKKVALTGALCKHLMGVSSCSPCAGLRPSGICQPPVPSAASRPRSNATHPISLVVPGNALVLQRAGKKLIASTVLPCLPGDHQENLRGFLWGLVLLLCCKRVLRCLPCVAAASGVGAHKHCEPVAATL